MILTPISRLVVPDEMYERAYGFWKDGFLGSIDGILASKKDISKLKAQAVEMEKKWVAMYEDLCGDSYE